MNYTTKFSSLESWILYRLKWLKRANCETIVRIRSDGCLVTHSFHRNKYIARIFPREMLLGTIMMTSSNGTIFRVTGHLCGEFTGKSPHKGQWRGALMFTLICTRINGWVNNREAGDLRRHRAHYVVIVMISSNSARTRSVMRLSSRGSLYWHGLILIVSRIIHYIP